MPVSTFQTDSGCRLLGHTMTVKHEIAQIGNFLGKL